MKKVYLLVGVPGSGKSWAAKQLADKFHHVPHDDYDERIYPSILLTATASEKPVLGEIPFGLSKIQESLEEHGCDVVPVFILEDEEALYRIWEERKLSKSSTIAGHLERQRTYKKRAKELGAFSGNSAQCLAHLEAVKI